MKKHAALNFHSDTYLLKIICLLSFLGQSCANQFRALWAGLALNLWTKVLHVCCHSGFICMTSEGEAAKNCKKKKLPNPTRSRSNMDTNKMEEKNQKGTEFFSWKYLLIKKKLYKIDR